MKCGVSNRWITTNAYRKELAALVSKATCDKRGVERCPSALANASRVGRARATEPVRHERISEGGGEGEEGKGRGGRKTWIVECPAAGA